MSTKVTDMAVAAGCFACHALLDGKDPDGFAYLLKNAPAAVVQRMLDGLTETHSLLILDEIIVIPDGVKA